MKRPKLIYEVYRANLTGAEKTKFNHRSEAIRFAKALKKNGYGVQTWKNVTNKHVSVVVEHWKQEGLAVSTIKEYLTGVRAVALAYGNTSIHTDNSLFGLPRRSYLSGPSKAMPEEVYTYLHEMLCKGDDHKQRLAAQIRVMRELGLRHEEARKINPDLAILEDGRIYISAGTKGGRDRVLNFATDRQREAVQALTPYIGKYGNTMPDDMNEARWENFVYNTLKEYGITKKESGASLHGLRHAYAQQRYFELMGVNAPCRFQNVLEYRKEVFLAHGPDWKQQHRRAVNIITHELGHNRESITTIYLGSYYV